MGQASQQNSNCATTRYGKDVIVEIDKGQILCRSYEPCEIMVRFDDKPARKFNGTPPADHSANIVFLSGYARFLAEAKAAHTIMVELPIYQDGNRVWMFAADNLDVNHLK